jgi:hypothetical protein
VAFWAGEARDTRCERHRAGDQGHLRESALCIESVGRQNESDSWTSGDVERPRRGWVEFAVP